MNKQELLEQITVQAKSGTLQLDEVVDAFKKARNVPHSQHLKISSVLYLLGGLIIFIGVSLFLQQNWDWFGSYARVATTLGVGIAAYVMAVILGREKKYEATSDAFHLLSGLVIPVGMIVFAHELGANLSSLWMQTVIMGVIALQQAVSFFVFKRTVILFFFIAYFTSFFIALTNWLIGDPIIDVSLHLSAYRLMSVGVSYLFLTSFLAKTQFRFLASFTAGFGTLFIIFALQFLFPWEKQIINLWEFLIPVVIGSLIYASTVLQSKSCLYFTSIYLVIYILQITNKHFAQSIGWPVAIIGAGLITIVVGYMSITLGKRFRR